MKKQKSTYSKIGSIFGLTLALTAVSASGLAVVLMGRLMQQEGIAYVQQSIGDTSTALGAHYKIEIEHFVELLSEVEKIQLNGSQSIGDPTAATAQAAPTPSAVTANENENEEENENEDRTVTATPNAALAVAAAQGPAASPVQTIGTLETHPAIIAMSLWRKGVPSGAFDLYPSPKRIYLGMNSKYSEPSAQLFSQIQSSEDAEKTLIQSAFQGHTIVTLAPHSIGQGNIAILAAPKGHGSTDQILVAHFRLDHFRRVLNQEGMVSTVLVDDSGNILAHPDSQQIGKKQENTPLFQAMHGSNLKSGQLSFIDRDVAYLGGYSRIGIGQLAVLAWVAESEATPVYKVLARPTILFLLISFIIFFCGGYFVYTRSGFLFYERRTGSSTGLQGGVKSGTIHSSATPAKDESNPQIALGFASDSALVGPQTPEAMDISGSRSFPPMTVVPQKSRVTLLHGSLKQLNQIIESEDPLHAADTINDFYSITESIVKEFGGIFEKFSGNSFIGIWTTPNDELLECWNAIRSALELRKAFFDLNEARKIDGQKPLSFGMGIHTGTGLLAKIGTVDRLEYTVVGEVVLCAKQLDHLTHSHQVDLLVSHSSWNPVHSRFSGDSLGEVKLTSDTGLMNFYSVSGYFDEQSQLVQVQVSPDSIPPKADLPQEGLTSNVLVKEKPAGRWLVNNGSQIVGPLTPAEIAGLLFLQELDFDCECWAEGIGTSSHIQDAEIFTGSRDQEAKLWVFDGKMVHGPMLGGFLKTAIDHGAIEPASFVCEGSTVSGWKKLAEWAKNYTPPAEKLIELKEFKLEDLVIPPPPPPPGTSENSMGSDDLDLSKLPEFKLENLIPPPPPPDSPGDSPLSQLPDQVITGSDKSTTEKKDQPIEKSAPTKRVA